MGRRMLFSSKFKVASWLVPLGLICVMAVAQEPKPAVAPGQTAAHRAQAAPDAGHEYSGMYNFLKEGEFVQVTVEDVGHVTGFVSRYGDGESDKGEFLDQFFKTGKLDGNKLSFTTETVHGVWFEFKGTVERGSGKTTDDEDYYTLKGTLTENVMDVNKQTSSHSREVALKRFPHDLGVTPARN